MNSLTSLMKRFQILCNTQNCFTFFKWTPTTSMCSYLCAPHEFFVFFSVAFLEISSNMYYHVFEKNTWSLSFCCFILFKIWFCSFTFRTLTKIIFLFTCYIFIKAWRNSRMTSPITERVDFFEKTFFFKKKKIIPTFPIKFVCIFTQ